MQADPAQIERHVAGLEKGPIVYVAAFLLAACIILFLALLRSTQTRAEMSDAHKKEIRELLEAERERATKLEVAFHSALEMVDVLREATRVLREALVEFRQRKPSTGGRKPTTNPSLPLPEKERGNG